METITKWVATLLITFVLIVNSAVAGYTPGKKHLEKEGVIGLLLYLNGKMIEHVFKPNLSACMKSKRVAQRQMDSNGKAERVQFQCKILVADIEEDVQAKYGFRIIKVHSGQ
jgi:hypothetical protein